MLLGVLIANKSPLFIILSVETARKYMVIDIDIKILFVSLLIDAVAMSIT